MQDHELYRRILGIEAPWYVEAVELKLEAGEIHVRLGHQVLEAPSEGAILAPHPFAPLSLLLHRLRTVLAVKGSLRRAQQRRALDRSGPF